MESVPLQSSDSFNSFGPKCTLENLLAAVLLLPFPSISKSSSSVRERRRLRRSGRRNQYLGNWNYRESGNTNSQCGRKWWLSLWYCDVGSDAPRDRLFSVQLINSSSQHHHRRHHRQAVAGTKCNSAAFIQPPLHPSCPCCPLKDWTEIPVINFMAINWPSCTFTDWMGRILIHGNHSKGWCSVRCSWSTL